VFGAGGVRAGGGWVVLAFGVGVINALVTSKVGLLGWTGSGIFLRFADRLVPNVSRWVRPDPGLGRFGEDRHAGERWVRWRFESGWAQTGLHLVFIWSSSGLRSCSMKGKRPLGVCINRHSVETAQVTGG
jgi:hypothetical protein